MTETLEATPSTGGDELAERLFLSGLGAFELLTVDLGVELGLYRALHSAVSQTSTELAATAGVAERYAREWLEQQAASGILAVDDVAADPHQRHYALRPGTADVLLDPESLRFSASLPKFLLSMMAVRDELVAAFRTGGGVPYGHYGQAMVEAQGAFNRPLFAHLLTGQWLPGALPDLHARLQGTRTRIADLACGVGWSSIALARAYPDCLVDGFDSDGESVRAAVGNAAEQDVADRVAFHVRDVSDTSPAASTYDAVFIFEALHDMAQPVAALSHVRSMLRAGGVCVVMDERVGDRFTAPADEVERFMYAASVLHCLPVGLATQPSAGTGTVLRRPLLTRYATEAGFTTVTDVEVEHDFFRLYLLEP